MKKFGFGAPIALAVVALVSPALAEDEIVVTATRASDGLSRDQIGGSVTLFSADDLERRQVRVVSDLLRDSPGVAVSRSGPTGNPTQIRIRGAEGNHTLVLIDGMDVSDPFSGEFEFGQLIADDLARVEVLRGQQSALYGSDAIGGVVQYITATGAEAPGARARFEAGSFNTGVLAARVAGVNGPLDWALSGNIYDTDGTPGIPGGQRDLAYENKTVAARLDYAVTDNLSLTAVLRAREATGDFNEDLDFDGLNDDSPGVYFDDEAVYGLVRADLSTFGDRWTHALIAQGVEAQRTSYSSFNTDDEAQRFKASYVTTLRFGSDDFDQRLTGAIDYREDSFQTLSLPEQTIEQTGVVLEYNALVGGRFGFGAAVRQDNNTRFDDSTTYRVQASYALTDATRLRAAAGTGVKNPIMSELFGYGFGYTGNPNLTPEESSGWEIGVEHRFRDALLVGVTYFDNELESEIRLTGFAPATPINLTGTSTQQGVELFAQAEFGPQWAFDFGYTYLDADEPLVGGGGSRTEIRRAEHIASANVSWRTADDRGGLNLNVRYNGDQWDDDFTTFPASMTLLDGYTLVGVGADWRLNEALEVYGRVENALDEDYQEVLGYAGVPLGVFVGVRAGF